MRCYFCVFCVAVGVHYCANVIVASPSFSQPLPEEHAKATERVMNRSKSLILTLPIMAVGHVDGDASAGGVSIAKAQMKNSFG